MNSSSINVNVTVIQLDFLCNLTVITLTGHYFKVLLSKHENKNNKMIHNYNIELFIINTYNKLIQLNISFNV